MTILTKKAHTKLVSSQRGTGTLSGPDLVATPVRYELQTYRALNALRSSGWLESDTDFPADIEGMTALTLALEDGRNVQVTISAVSGLTLVEVTAI